MYLINNNEIHLYLEHFASKTILGFGKWLVAITPYKLPFFPDNYTLKIMNILIKVVEYLSEI